MQSKIFNIVGVVLTVALIAVCWEYILAIAILAFLIFLFMLFRILF